MSARFDEPLGGHGNAWANVATGANTNSGVLDTRCSGIVSGFGHAGGATTITLMASMDGVNFYAAATQVLAAAADFHITLQTAARYVCLQSTNNVTATGTLAAKPTA